MFARFLLAEKLLDFQDFPVIAKQRCFNLIVLLYTTHLCRIFANHFSSGAKIFALIFAREQRSGKDAVFALGEGQRWGFPVWGIYVF